MVNNSTNINKANNHFSLSLTEHNKTKLRHITYVLQQPMSVKNKCLFKQTLENKSKGKPRTDIPETLATFDIQDTGPRQTKQNKKETKHNKKYKQHDPGVREW